MSGINSKGTTRPFQSTSISGQPTQETATTPTNITNDDASTFVSSGGVGDNFPLPPTTTTSAEAGPSLLSLQLSGGAGRTTGLSQEQRVQLAKLDQVFEALGIDDQAVTSPEVMRKSLIDMNLLEEGSLDSIFKPTSMQSELHRLGMASSSEPSFALKQVETFLQDVATKPMHMGPMIESMKLGIIKHQPVLAKMLTQESEHSQEALAAFKPMVEEFLAKGFIYEQLVFAMSNYNDVLGALVLGMDQKNKLEADMDHDSNIDRFKESKALFEKGGMEAAGFTALKIETVQPVVVMYMFARAKGGKLTAEDLDFIKEEYGLSFLNKKALEDAVAETQNPKAGDPWSLLKVNIAEALISDQSDGNVDNEVVAFALNKLLDVRGGGKHFVNGPVLPRDTDPALYGDLFAPEKMEDNVHRVYDFDEDWTQLYETWNIAFVGESISDLQTVLPKLFIPSVLNAKPEDYMFTRAIGLWLTTNTLLSMRINEREIVETPEAFKNFIQDWKEANLEATKEIPVFANDESWEELQTEYDEQFTHLPWLNFAGMVADHSTGKPTVGNVIRGVRKGLNKVREGFDYLFFRD